MNPFRIAVALVLVPGISFTEAVAPRLTISDNKQFLVTTGGRPFSILNARPLAIIQ